MMWKEKYKIGVKLIDEQHQELFRRVSDFIKTVQSEGKWEEKLSKVKETLEFMKECVITHFNDEEIYQKDIGYPGYEEHSQIHEKLKYEVVNIISGNAVTNLAKEGYICDIVPPQVIIGENKSISIATEKTLIFPMKTEIGKFEINISIKENR
jgi:hemerythrin